MFDLPLGLPNSIDLAIVGAGPHALTLVTHLLQRKKPLRGRFLVFDPSSTWMQQWQQQLAAFEIPHLRSPAVQQPDPSFWVGAEALMQRIGRVIGEGWGGGNRHLQLIILFDR